MFIVNEYNKRFGGRTTKSWNSKGAYIEDGEAFIFSLD